MFYQSVQRGFPFWIGVGGNSETLGKGVKERGKADRINELRATYYLP